MNKSFDSLINKCHFCDCLEGMKKLPDESIDAIVTDPPYGLSPTDHWRCGMTKTATKGFMGKTWDVLPSIEIWQECLRALKSGAFAFIMSSPRLDCLSQTAYKLQKTGFDISFTPIFWAYASGFPKALNISKAVDKRFGVERTRVPATGNLHNSKVSHGWSEREYSGDMADTTPITPQAKALDGSYAGFQPKPSVEVIIVAMKPLSEKTFVDQALKNRKGITWLDDGRIPYKDESAWWRIQKEGCWIAHNIYGDRKRLLKQYGNQQGRFPANLLASDNILDNEIAKESSSLSSIDNDVTYDYEDLALFSRYFDLDRWFRERIKLLPKSVQKTFPFLIVPKPSKKEKRLRIISRPKDKPFHHYTTEQNKLSGIFHPTVKPLKLMHYLITIGSREGDIILDPFMGSGTTALAAQHLNRKWIGFEINKEYQSIIKARLAQKSIRQWCND